MAAKTVPSAPHLIAISTVISTISTIRLQCDSAASSNIFQFSPFFRLLFLSLFFAPPNPPPLPPLLLCPSILLFVFVFYFFGPLSGRHRERLLERQPVVEQPRTVASPDNGGTGRDRTGRPAD